MFTRSEIRHACYRAKNNQPYKQVVLDLVTPKLTAGETWDNFSTQWDLFLDAKGEVHIIKPESDYDYTHSVCLEKAICVNHKVEANFDNRAENVIQIVELNMLAIMNWSTYNKTWGIEIDHELKRIHTKLFKTVVNDVTFPVQEIETEREDKVVFTPMTMEPMSQEDGKEFMAMMEKKKLDDLDNAKRAIKNKKSRKIKQ